MFVTNCFFKINIIMDENTYTYKSHPPSSVVKPRTSPRSLSFKTPEFRAKTCSFTPISSGNSTADSIHEDYLERRSTTVVFPEV